MSGFSIACRGLTEWVQIANNVAPGFDNVNIVHKTKADAARTTQASAF